VTALLIVGALLTLAQGAASVALWRRVRESRLTLARCLAEYAANNRGDVKALREQSDRLIERIRVLEAQALTFAKHSDLVAVASAGAAASRESLENCRTLAADLEQHRRGSRHRRVRK